MQGILVGEPIPFKDVKSINSLFRGQVRLPDASLKSCLLKNLGRVELVNELISNLLAVNLGLPVPLAVLTFIPEKFNEAGQFDKAFPFDGGCLAFGSVDVQTPNLAQRFNAGHPTVKKLISDTLNKWSHRSYLYGFDTWLANVDRHAGNVLFGNNNELWLIDHGQCFTKKDRSPQELVPNAIYAN